MTSFAARSILRSASTSARGAATRISAGAKPRASPSPFRVSTQKPLSARIFRSPVEMSSVSVASMLPYHTATASAVLTSMLSVAPRSHAWTLEDPVQEDINGKKRLGEGREMEVTPIDQFCAWNIDEIAVNKSVVHTSATAMASFAARSVMRSASTSARGAAARISAGAKPRASPTPFRLPTQQPLSARIFRSPVEMSSVNVASLLPYHTATASAVLTSMLSVAPRGYGWTLEVATAMASFAARSVMRSASTSVRAAATRISAGAKPRASPSPFRFPTQQPLSARIFRSPVEMSSVNVASLLPYHTATASAVLTSMLSVAPRGYGWTLEGSCFISLDTHSWGTKRLDEGREMENVLMCFVEVGAPETTIAIRPRQFPLYSARSSSLKNS
ncbi:nuclear fusion defective 6 [Striga asiatica]|uniref:Nuclear fusion defective 6 n=1 Tax=Striga asiatica TaxID=4170 RepID=A0A5A7PUS8_STRAF|nr:nuclear fusion defective 6 [Striga asiatica]